MLMSRNHHLTTDQASEYGGEDLGPMASELLLSAIASCFGQSMLYVASRMRRQISELCLDVESEKDAEHFRISEVSVSIRAKCDPDVLRKVADMAKKYCFVTNSLSADIRFSYVIRDAG